MSGGSSRRYPPELRERVIYEQANAHGQKVQAAGNNMAQTDSAVGSSWA